MPFFLLAAAYEQEFHGCEPKKGISVQYRRHAGFQDINSLFITQENPLYLNVYYKKLCCLNFALASALEIAMTRNIWHHYYFFGWREQNWVSMITYMWRWENICSPSIRIHLSAQTKTALSGALTVGAKPGALRVVATVPPKTTTLHAPCSQICFRSCFKRSAWEKTIRRRSTSWHRGKQIFWNIRM